MTTIDINESTHSVLKNLSNASKIPMKELIDSMVDGYSRVIADVIDKNDCSDSVGLKKKVADQKVYIRNLQERLERVKKGEK